MTLVRTCWLLCVLVAIAAYGFVLAPREREIADAHDRAALLYSGATLNEAHIRAAARLREVQDRVAADVRALAGLTDESALTAATLRLLSTEADRYHVRVTTITPAASKAAGTQTQDALIGTPAEIGVSGRFRDVVAFLADTPKHDVLFGVDDVTLGTQGAERSSGSPTLAVTMHATFYRLRPIALTEIDHVATH